VLSSLLPAQQQRELERTQAALAAISGIQLSHVFSIPFGGADHYDQHTLAAVSSLDYKGILLSRSRLNWGPRRQYRGLVVVERFMPRGPSMNATIRRML
jgi:hypothetical protein